ncbi:hypothetical protein JCM10213_004507 [Rhodosporidiobolus nylandii]
MAGRAASKSPAPPVRRSSRHSTPTREALSPPPASRSRASLLPSPASTPSLSSLVPPSNTTAGGMSKSPSARALSPRLAARVSRPPLPTDKANKAMQDNAARPAKVHKVKTQTLHLGEGGGTITIARVKCPVPKGTPGHIIKRFDTNAVSASSLFRAAYPLAAAEEEAQEMRWVAIGSRGQYGDTAAAGLEDDETKKLSGTWIPAEHAMALAGEYNVTRYVSELVSFTAEDGAAEPETPEPLTSSGVAPDTNDSSASRSPRAKRARVSSPLANKSSAPAVQALSGASGPGVSIHQTLERTMSGTVTESTEIRVDVPLPAPAADGEEVATFDEAGAAQLEEAKRLVEELKEAGTLAELAEATQIPEPAPVATKKRALEQDGDEDPTLPENGTLADALVIDNRSFLSKLFRRNKRKPKQASRETRALPAPSASTSRTPEVVVREEGEQGEPRRWAAGLGLAVAVGATAAAPYLFG